MNQRKGFSIKHFFILLCLVPAIVQADEYFESVTNYFQIHGCWKRILFPKETTENLNKFEIYPLKYQWYCFMDGGELYTMHSNRDSDYSRKELVRKITLFPSAEKYTILPDGIIKVHHTDVGETTYWVSSIVVKNFSIGDVALIKGDALMTIRDPVSGEDVYYRFLRKIENIQGK